MNPNLAATARPRLAVRAVTVVAVVAALLVAAWVPSASAREITPELEDELVELVNAERSGAGLAPLTVELQLTRIARDWSGTMGERGGISHRPRLAGQIDGDWRRIGENVGVGPELRRIHDAFMASPSHRDNVLGDFDRVGVGVVRHDDRLWVTVNFLRGSGDFPVFTDVTSNAHRPGIEAVFARATTLGCDDTRYCPEQAVTRGQMATFLSRELGLTPRRGWFRDVPTRHPHAEAIGALAAAGITDGCGRDTFCPDERVNRAQLASFLARALDLTERAPTGLDDVPTGHTHAGAIGALQREGITAGCTSSTFCPTDRVSRAQMATFLARAFGG